MEQEEEKLLEIIDEQKEKIAELGKEVNIIKAGNIALSRLAAELETKLADGDGAIDGLIDRINAMALAYGQLQQSDSGKMSMWMYATNIVSPPRFERRGISMNVDIPMDLALPAEIAIPCGWIINELVSNAFEHAFPGGNGRKGEVKVAMEVVKGKMSLGFSMDGKLREENDKIELIVSDDGVGFPIDAFEAKMGAAIVKSLMKQLGAKMEIDHNNGTKFTIRFEI